MDQVIRITRGLKQKWDAEEVTVKDFLKEQSTTWGTSCLFELLKHEDDKPVVPYFDYDEECSCQPSDLKSIRQKCIDALTGIFSADTDFDPDVNIKVGYRHGWLPSGKYKVSYRFWVRRYSILMQHIPSLIKACSKEEWEDLWDLQVYSAKRKMGLPGSCKSPEDPRVLELEDRNHPELCIIQYLDGSETPLQDFEASTAYSNVSRCHPPENWAAILPLLKDFGFTDPCFIGTRPQSITFRSNLGESCPCCPHTHDHQSYYVKQCPDGRLMVKSYSLRCKKQMLGEAKYLFSPEDGAAQMDIVPSQHQALSNTLDMAFFQALGAHMDPHSVVKTDYGFDFRTMDNGAPCKLCRQVHTHQTYQCHTLVLPSCKVMSQLRDCETVVGYDAPILKRLIRNPKEDTAFAEMFAMQQQYHGIRWVHSGQEWYRFNGSLWRPVIFPDLSRTLCAVASQALTSLALFMGNQELRQKANLDSQFTPEQIRNCNKSLWTARDYVQGLTGLKNIIDLAKNYTMYDSEFAARLNKDRDVAGAPNGVICLKSGELLKGAADQYVSKQVGVEYHGLNHPTPDVESFFQDVFNGDTAVIAYLQTYIGHTLTGHTKEQVFGIFWGTGSNSKSVLADLLRLTFGDYFKNMARDCLFACDGRKSTNAASPHLAELNHVRLGVVEESQDTDVLDAAMIKTVTGSSQINCRFQYQNNQVIDITHKPLLLTNFKPRINVDDSAMLRRLMVVPFLNIYKAEKDMDPSNPHHRLMDPHLKDKLSTPPVLSQFLTWVVQGAVRWYQQGLGEKPGLLREAEQNYIGENDVLGEFLKTSCQQGREFKVETRAFKEAYEIATDSKLKADVLIKKMRLRGFTASKKRITPEANPTSHYVGLRIVG